MEKAALDRHITQEEPDKQTWKITTTVQYDNEDNDEIGTTVDYETYPHVEPLGIADWSEHGECFDSEHDEYGQLARAYFERFDNEYDRSAEVWFPVIVTTLVERMEPGE